MNIRETIAQDDPDIDVIIIFKTAISPTKCWLETKTPKVVIDKVDSNVPRSLKTDES